MVTSTGHITQSMNRPHVAHHTMWLTLEIVEARIQGNVTPLFSRKVNNKIKNILYEFADWRTLQSNLLLFSGKQNTPAEMDTIP